MELKDFSGCVISSTSSCCQPYNGMVVEKTVRKAFPKDNDSTLYIVKVKGVKAYMQLYADEMVAPSEKSR